MKVTICTYDGSGRFGGPFTWLRRLLPALVQRGLELRVLALTECPDDECYNLEEYRAAGVEVKTLQRGSLSQYGDNTEARVQWLLRELRADRPDVFIANMVLEAFYASRWAREAGIATLGILHSDDEFSQGLIEEFVEGETEYRLSCLVSVSAALHELVAPRATRSTDTALIPYFVPIPECRARRADGSLRLVYAGRLVQEQKRIREVTEALCRVVREIEGTEAVLYGEGREREMVEGIIRANRAGELVRVGGVVDSAALQSRLAESQIFVMLSDYEGLPIALLEAMATGVVPVCLRIRSGVGELVRDGETGFLVEDREDGFLSAIRRLRDVDTWERMSLRARELVSESYSVDVVADQWKNLFEATVAKSERRGSVLVPSTVHLPPVNRRLAGSDRRWPGFAGYARNQVARVWRRANANWRSPFSDGGGR